MTIPTPQPITSLELNKEHHFSHRSILITLQRAKRMLYYDSKIVTISIGTDAQTIIQCLQVNTYLMP